MIIYIRLNRLIENQIGILVVGNNPNWKQGINLGKKNNQNFVQIPFFKLIEQLKYKAKLVGIKVIINEESYTSIASFLDLNDLPVYQKGVKYRFSGKRVRKRLYKALNGFKYNADVNGTDIPQIFIYLYVYLYFQIDFYEKTSF